MTDLPPAVLAAGVVVHRADGRVALVHRPRYDDWSLPKGKLEKGEPAAVGAVRECWEETGVRARLEAPLPEITYRVAAGSKLVRYWRAAVGDDDGFTPGTEVDRLRWVAPTQAARVLTNAADADVVAASAAIGPTRTLLVLRHAEAVPRREWARSLGRSADDVRPLTTGGFAQAQHLASLLACYRPQRIVSSPARRCQQTLEPIAALAATTVELDDRYSEACAAREPHEIRVAVTALLTEQRPVVVCTHRPVLPHLVAALVADGTTAGSATDLTTGLAGEPPLQPASCLVLHRDDSGRLVSYERHRTPHRV